jgi:long-chain acyl-CoA synthetase
VLGPYEVGEIWVSGPTLFRGYWRQPEATAAALVEGWLRTGDVGHLDDEGFLYIDDRLKDMILRGGINVYCAEVESVIYEHPSVLEVAVCGLPDERWGECVAAVVVVREDGYLNEERLRDFLAPRLAHYKIPARIAFTTERLPTNAAGKVAKRSLAVRYFRNAP